MENNQINAIEFKREQNIVWRYLFYPIFSDYRSCEKIFHQLPTRSRLPNSFRCDYLDGYLFLGAI